MSASCSLRGVTPNTMPPSLMPRSYIFARSSGMPYPIRPPIRAPSAPPVPAPVTAAARGPIAMMGRPGTATPAAANPASSAPSPPPLTAPTPAPSAAFVPRSVFLPSSCGKWSFMEPSSVLTSIQPFLGSTFVTRPSIMWRPAAVSAGDGVDIDRLGMVVDLSVAGAFDLSDIGLSVVDCAYATAPDESSTTLAANVIRVSTDVLMRPSARLDFRRPDRPRFHCEHCPDQDSQAPESIRHAT